MNTNTRKKVGAYLLLIGGALLIAAVLVAFSVGTVMAPILLGLSVLVNTAGVTALRPRD